MLIFSACLSGFPKIVHNLDIRKIATVLDLAVIVQTSMFDNYI